MIYLKSKSKSEEFDTLPYEGARKQYRIRVEPDFNEKQKEHPKWIKDF